MNEYSVVMFLVAGFFVYFIYKKSRHLLPPALFWKISFWVGVFTILGAKIFHYLENYLTYQSELNFFSTYGFSILGAIFFGFGAMFFFSVIYKFNLDTLSDKVFLHLPIFQSFGRIGNIFNNELLPFSYYEIGLNLVNYFVLIYLSKLKYKPGLITAVYFLNYGIIRFFIEMSKGNMVGFLTIMSYLFFAYGFLRTFKIIFKI